MSNEITLDFDGDSFLEGLAAIPGNVTPGTALMLEFLNKLTRWLNQPDFMIESVSFGVTDSYLGSKIDSRTYQVFIDTMTRAYQFDITDAYRYSPAILFRIEGEKEYGNYLIDNPAIKNVLNLIFCLIENYTNLSIEEFSRGYLHYYT